MRRFFPTLVFVALLPLVGHAETASLTDPALIASLVAQIQGLTLQIQTAKSSASVSTCSAPLHVLARGATGSDVMRLQQLLSQDVAIFPDPQITGFFGPLTEKAVQRFQAANAVVTTGTPLSTGFGSVGPVTLALLRTKAGCDNQVVATIISSGVTGPTQNVNPQSYLTPVNAIIPALPSITFTKPIAGTRVTQGAGLSIEWKSDSAPSGSTVTLALKNASGKIIATLVQGKPANSAYFWALPAPLETTSPSACSSDPITCLLALATPAATSCQGSLCSVAAGTYTISGALSSTGTTYSTTESATFTVTAASSSPTIHSSGVAASPSNADSLGGSYSQSAADLISNLYNTPNQQAGYSEPRGCTYSGISYPDGIILTVGCSDLAGQACTAGGSQLTCKAGQWVAPDGSAPLIKNVTNATTTAGSCMTPWQSLSVPSGQQVPYQPFFTNGLYANSGARVNLMQCTSGAWQQCDFQGASCHAFYAQ